MKQFIVLCAMIVLGVFLYQLIAGGDDSLYHTVGLLWQSEIDARNAFP